MKIGVVGYGYVGRATARYFERGHDVHTYLITQQITIRTGSTVAIWSLSAFQRLLLRTDRAVIYPQ